MTLCSDLIRTARDRYLLGGQVEQRNRLNADYTAGQTTLAFLYPLNGIQVGTTLSIDLNTFYVWDVNVANQTATVEGGYAGSTDANAASGTAVQVAPRWSNSSIFRALNEELAALSSPSTGLYQMKQTEFTYNASRIGFDLPGVGTVNDIYEVRYTQPDQYLRTPVVPRTMWRLERNYLNTENSSTYSLKLLAAVSPGQTVTVLYKAPFTQFSAYTDDVTITGFPTSAVDILPMGATLRVGAGSEVRRNSLSAQGDTRRATEVPPGAVAGSWRQVAVLREQRITEEAARLAAAYPLRRG